MQFLTQARLDSLYGALFTDTDGTTVTFDLSKASAHQVTLGGNRTLALANDQGAQEFVLILQQDTTGSRTVTWWSGITWQGNYTPVLSTAPGAADVLGFVRTGTGTYIGYPLSGPPQIANDFGNGADGAGSFTDGSTHTLETTTAADDTGYVLKQYTSLTITGASTVVTANHRAQCMVVKVQGNCTIGNGSGGTLHMNSKGAAATPTNATTLARNVTNLFGERAQQLFTIPQAGASGGSGGTTGVSANGSAGSNGSNGQTGGGGGGAGGGGGSSQIGLGGAGAAGTAYCGGSGGGAGGYNGSIGTNGVAGSANGGTGGNSGTLSGASTSGGAGAGAGNPVGTGSAISPATLTAPTGGGGGTLILVVGGNLTIGSGGVISANGGAGGSVTGNGVQRTMGGGGAGGGSVIVLYAGTLSNSGTIQANGGAGGTATGGTASNNAGGAGGSGSIQGPTQIATQ